MGVIGFSQGGHILPAAASRSRNVSFAIDVSGSVVPMKEQIADEVEMSAERAGLTAGQIKLVSEINALGLRFVETAKDEDWNDYYVRLSRAREGLPASNPVFQRFPTNRDQPALIHLRAIVGFDPMLYWKRVTIPSLFVFGANDTQVRVKKSIIRLQTELPADKFNYTVTLFSSNGHALYREDLMDFVSRWIIEGAKP